MATRLSLLFLIVFLVYARPSAALDVQGHIRTGYIQGAYSGLFSGNFHLNTSLDLSCEFFLNRDGSFFFRFVQGFDSPDSRPFYTYAGMGMNYYFWGRGSKTDQTASGMEVAAAPTIRSYVGFDAGISQVLVKSFGPTVQAVSNMMDLGGHVGAIYQMTRQFGVEAEAGASYGYGMSSTAANGHVEKLMLGLSYFF